MTTEQQQQMQFARFLLGATVGHVAEVFGIQVARDLALELANNDAFFAQLERGLGPKQAVLDEALAKIRGL